LAGREEIGTDTPFVGLIFFATLKTLDIPAAGRMCAAALNVSTPATGVAGFLLRVDRGVAVLELACVLGLTTHGATGQTQYPLAVRHEARGVFSDRVSDVTFVRPHG
jgi:hypothetical protein